jgi:O-acetyl-ADP-ribose deacetylase
MAVEGAKIAYEVPNKKRAEVVINGWLKVSVNLGDITNEDVDAITNAANEHLMHGSGVAGAIMKKGGYEVQTLSDKWVDKFGKVETGNAAWTLPGKIKNCKYIIHAVGPVWSNVSQKILVNHF